MNIELSNEEAKLLGLAIANALYDIDPENEMSDRYADLFARLRPELKAEPTYEEKLAAAHAEADAHGPYAYGDTSNPVAQVQFEEAQRKLQEAVKACPYCKGAKTRALKKFGKVAKANDAMCSEHRDRSRSNFATSPVSEHYWSN